MKVSEVLLLDYRNDENKLKIQSVLKKIKPLSRYLEEVPIEALEDMILYITNKYDIQPQWICQVYYRGENPTHIYSCSLKTVNDSVWLEELISACSIYELFAKITIGMYGYVKAGKVGLYKPKKHEVEREKLAKKADEKRTRDES